MRMEVTEGKKFFVEIQTKIDYFKKSDRLNDIVASVIDGVALK